jgi:hypothetical protein
MGWFKVAEDNNDPFLHVVSVRRTDDDRKAAGAGFVLGADTVLTCAHVVNDALGRAMFESRPPGPDEISVEVRDVSRSQLYLARVAHWIPARARGGGVVREGDDEWLGDLAVLRVDGPVGGLPTAPDRAAMTAGQKVDAWHGGGRAATLARLAVASLHGSLGYLDGEATGMAVGPSRSHHRGPAPAQPPAPDPAQLGHPLAVRGSRTAPPWRP